MNSGPASDNSSTPTSLQANAPHVYSLPRSLIIVIYIPILTNFQFIPYLFITSTLTVYFTHQYVREIPNGSK